MAKKYKYVTKWVITDQNKFKWAILLLAGGIPMLIMAVMMLGGTIKVDHVLIIIATLTIGIFNTLNGLMRMDECVKHKRTRVKLSAAEQLLGD